jgi:hypothetical protein
LKFHENLPPTDAPLARSMSRCREKRRAQGNPTHQVTVHSDPDERAKSTEPRQVDFGNAAHVMRVATRTRAKGSRKGLGARPECDIRHLSEHLRRPKHIEGHVNTFGAVSETDRKLLDEV